MIKILRKSRVILYCYAGEYLGIYYKYKFNWREATWPSPNPWIPYEIYHNCGFYLQINDEDIMNHPNRYDKFIMRNGKYYPFVEK